jgi:hypothetical protein
MLIYSGPHHDPEVDPSPSSGDAEVDCPWFEPTWLLDNPDFPAAQSVPTATEEAA